MNKLTASITASVAAFILYLVLSIGSATENDAILLWSSPELIFGAILSIIVGLLCAGVWKENKTAKIANPLRLVLLVLYIIPFLIELTLANLTVAYSIITGKKIKQGIVKTTPGMKNDISTLLLSASITYQPGTFVVETNNETRELYVHMLNVEDKTGKTQTPDSIFSKINLAKIIRRITE